MRFMGGVRMLLGNPVGQKKNPHAASHQSLNETSQEPVIFSSSCVIGSLRKSVRVPMSFASKFKLSG